MLVSAHVFMLYDDTDTIKDSYMAFRDEMFEPMPLTEGVTVATPICASYTTLPRFG